MIDSREVIRHDCDADQWSDFESKVEMIKAEYLNSINSRLNAGVPDFSNWHDYVNAFAQYSWRDFTMAYEWATDRTY